MTSISSSPAIACMPTSGWWAVPAIAAGAYSSPGQPEKSAKSAVVTRRQTACRYTNLGTARTAICMSAAEMGLRHTGRDIRKGMQVRTLNKVVLFSKEYPPYVYGGAGVH